MSNVSEAYNEMMQGDAPVNWVRPKISKRITGSLAAFDGEIFLIAGEGITYGSRHIKSYIPKTSK